MNNNSNHDFFDSTLYMYNFEILNDHKNNINNTSIMYEKDDEDDDEDSLDRSDSLVDPSSDPSSDPKVKRQKRRLIGINLKADHNLNCPVVLYVRYYLVYQENRWYLYNILIFI